MEGVNKLIKEIEDGVKQSIDAVKAKITLVIEKADELTEGGKKQYRLYELKNRRQGQFSAIGEELHQLVAEKTLRISNQKLKNLLSAIDKTNSEIARLEGKTSKATSRKTPRRTTPVKPKTAVKKKADLKAV